jgi:hypothetical protein
MRWTPTKISRSNPPNEALAGVVPASRPRNGLMSVRSAAGLAVTIASLAGASVAGAQEVTGLMAVETASHWPWIAAGAILTLLIAVSFVSRRRIYAVVGR